MATRRLIILVCAGVSGSLPNFNSVYFSSSSPLESVSSASSTSLFLAGVGAPVVGADVGAAVVGKIRGAKL